MLVFEKRGKPEYPEKNLSEQGENQQQTQPTYDAGTENNVLSSVAIKSKKKKKWLKLFFLAVVRKIMLRLFLLRTKLLKKKKQVFIQTDLHFSTACISSLQSFIVLLS